MRIKLLMLSVFFLAAGTGTAAAFNECSIFSDRRYQGTNIALGAGRSIPNLKRYKMNDKISSIEINDSRCRLEVWEHPNYKGRYADIRSNISRLTRWNGWKLEDEISSLRCSCRK